MTARSLYFTAPRTVAVRERPVPEPDPDEVLVRTERSAISPGTELLVYRDEVEPDEVADETIEAMDGDLSYPTRYGYAAVGRVSAVGSAVADSWLDRRVFAFHPHESHFTASPEALVPTDLPTDRALLVPNVETAVSLTMDARPRVGARVVVFGQGPVGLLTTALLAEFPLARLVTVDPVEDRRAYSERLGADRSVPPEELDATLAEPPDVSLELSGNPAALDDALSVTGYAGRVVVGSWYGTKDVGLALGTDFHRSHVRVQVSQVSRVDPDHAGRWDKSRRLDYVRSWLADTDAPLGALFTHEFALDRAGEAYELLDERADGALQAALVYE
jgi:alcohol dehydrogenase